jgi:hypothetical protein
VVVVLRAPVVLDLTVFSVVQLVVPFFLNWSFTDWFAMPP